MQKIMFLSPFASIFLLGLLFVFAPAYCNPDLMMTEFVRSVTNNSVGTSTPPPITPGGILQVTGTLKNSGTLAAVASKLRFYLSSDQSYNSTDMALGYLNGNALTANQMQFIIEHTLTIPTTTIVGNYYILCRVDADSQVAEGNETNNLYNFPITIVALPDLIILSPNAPTTAVKGTSQTISCTVKNNGLAAAGTSNLRFYLSSNALYETADILLGYISVSSLSVNATSLRSKQVIIPATTVPGTYYVLYRADAQFQVNENNENNNISSRAIAIQ